MKKQIWKIISICISIVFAVALLSALLIYKKFSTETVTTIITFVLVILIYYILLKHKQRKNVIMHDEYTEHQDLKSFRNSWIITVFAVGIMSNIDLFGLYSFQTKTVFGVILIVMILSFWISHFIYLKRPNAK